jgi:hypothetical protein
MSVAQKEQLQKLCNEKLVYEQSKAVIDFKDPKVKDIIKKIQKVVSKNKNTIFTVQSPEYSAKNGEES